jgi:hypothetical protein
MDELGVVLLVGVVIVALFVVLIVVSARHARERERQRRAWFHHWAVQNGWVLTVKPSVMWTSRLPGQSRSGVTLMMSAVMHGRPVSVAEYVYYTTSSDSSGSSTTTAHHLLVTAVQLPGHYPTVAVHPRGALSKLGHAMFGNESAIGHHDFDRRFRIRTKDPASARTLFGPALVAEHLAGRIPSSWSVAGRDLLTWQSGQLTDPHQVPALALPLLYLAGLLGR